MATQASTFTIFSLGEAAGNLIVGQRELEVIPKESFSQIDGEVTDATAEIEAQGIDRENNAYTTKVKTANSIKATYLSFDPHKPFPSLIRRGEKVIIYRLADTDKYYWSPLGLDDTTRRKDVLIIAVPNSPKENENSRTPETAYYIEVNTVDKHITIQTNKNDGEPYAYVVQINTKDGFISLGDDVGQFINLVSKEQRITLQNASDSEVTIEKGKGLFKTNVEIRMETKSFIVKADKADFQTQKWNMQGSDFAVKANGTFTGSLKNNGINVGSTHYHIGNLGNPTSTPQG